MKNVTKTLIAVVSSTCLGLVTLSASALYTDNPEKVISIGTPQKAKKKVPQVLTAGYSPNIQVVCLNRKPTGTRIKKRVCQTAAAWKAQFENENIRKYVLQQ